MNLLRSTYPQYIESNSFSDVKTVFIVIIIVAIIISILVFGAIMKIYDIFDIVKRQRNILLKQHEQLDTLIELQKEQNELIKKLLPESATNITTPCTTDKDINDNDQL